MVELSGSDGALHAGAGAVGDDTGVDRHRREIVIWDVPPVQVGGAAFTIRVGLKCRSACRPAGWQIEVVDHGGVRVAAGAAGNEPWPGTAGLFHATLALAAPTQAGRYDWTVVALPAAASGDAPGSHPPVQARFAIRTEDRAACRLTVVAVDRVSGAPVAGARAVVHPWRARTDADGIAEFSLPGGPFRLFVSGKDRRPCRHDGVLDGALTVRVELEADAGPGDAELWA